MLEQDVQLTRLIVERLTDLDQRKQSVGWQLSEAQERLDKIESLKTQRSQYEGVLERAAALLGRDDLRVEIDVPADDTKLAEELSSELSILEAEQAQYLELVDELKQRAPELLQAAAGMAPEALQSYFAAAPETSAQDEDIQEASEADAELASVDWEDDESSGSAASLAQAELAAELKPETVTEAETEATYASVQVPSSFAPPGEELAQRSSEEEEEIEEGAVAMTGLQWPEMSEEPELPATVLSHNVWDDEDSAAPAPVNYAELGVEPASTNGHYSNGSHAVEIEDAETLSLQDEETAVAGLEEEAVAVLEEQTLGAFADEPVGDPEEEGELAELEELALGSESGEAFENRFSFDTLGSDEVHGPGSSNGGDHALSFEDYQVAHSEYSSGTFRSDTETAGEAEQEATAVAVMDSQTAVEEEVVVNEEDTRERLIRLSRFDHAHMSSKIEGGAPVFVIDATAVLERIPHYDRYHLALDESAARDELVRDFCFLAAEMHTDFHLVFNDPHHPGLEPNHFVHLEHGDIESGDPNPGDQRIQEIVLDYIEHERQAALVTSDPMLMGLFKGENVLVFSLGEFFLT